MKERIAYIDVAKTMAIFFVVFGHTIELTKMNAVMVGNLDLLAYTLHVPSFLFLSGFLLQGTIQRYDIRQIFWMKFFDLFCVWVLWSILLTVWNIGIDKCFGQYTGNIVEYIKYSTNEIWYLVFLFAGIIFILVVEKLRMNSLVCTFGLFISFIVFSFVSVTIAKVFIHLLIVWMGYKFHGFHKKVAIGIVFLYVTMMIVIYSTGCLTLQSINALGFGTMGLLGIKLLSCLVLPAIAYLLVDARKQRTSEKNKICHVIGANTLYIYILHFLPLAIYKCIGNTSLLVAIICVFVLILIALVIRFVMKESIVKRLLFTPYVQIKNLKS